MCTHDDDGPAECCGVRGGTNTIVEACVVAVCGLLWVLLAAMIVKGL